MSGTVSSGTGATAAARRAGSARLRHLVAVLARHRQWLLPVVLLIEVVVFLPYSGIRFDSASIALTGMRFYAGDLVSQAAPLLILAGGMTLVLMTAGIDLSIGSMVALVGCVMSTFPGEASFWYTAVPLGLALGVGLGLFNGLLISRMDVPPIVATLGTLFFYRGLCSVVMRGRENSPFYDVPGYHLLGEPLGCLVIVVLLVMAGGWYFRHSAVRRELLMLGGNRIAARYAGIPVFGRLLGVYTLMGLLAAVAALCASSRDGSVTASWQTGLELQVIVAVVLGGTRVDGGNGSVAGSLLGVALIAVLEEGLRGAAVSELRLILLGGLLLAGVWLNAASERAVEYDGAESTRGSSQDE